MLEMGRQLTRDQAATLRDQPVYDKDWDKIGDADRVLYNACTGEMEWIGISTGFLAGLLGTKTVLVPVATASIDNDGISVPYTKDQVKEAPHATIEMDAISEADERTLFEYYGLHYSERRSESQLPEHGPSRGTEAPRATEAGTWPHVAPRDWLGERD